MYRCSRQFSSSSRVVVCVVLDEVGGFLGGLIVYVGVVVGKVVGLFV